jgi:probable F420-dependent oxidoreductase
MPELGCYTLAGGPPSPRALFDEVRQADEMGMGTTFISERWNVKEAVTLSGAAAGVSTRTRIATAATNHNLRHPVVTAAYASTMHLLTEGRFMLGLGRGIKPIFDAFGLPAVTTAQLEDFAGLMRRLWQGETVVDYDGPAGRYPALVLDRDFRLDIPLGITAFGPHTLELAGRAFDEVILHTFFSDETLQRCVRTVKEAAERAGRDPGRVRVWSVLATVGDHLPAEARLRKSVGRLATYLQIYGDLLVRTNNWDPQVLERFREDPVVRSYGRTMLDGKATIPELEHLAGILPDEWTAPMASGSPEECANEVRRQMDLGADAVILHGATPAELRPVVDAYRSVPPAPA